jgi:uncharacterized membrane protein YeaQ/YmgE (transglycosylase-associated protein family)
LADTGRPARYHFSPNARRLRGEDFIVTAQSILIWLIVGGVAGWLAGVIVRGFGFGLLGNIIVGIVGALIAGWLLPRIGIGGIVRQPVVDAIIHALIGAVILLLIIGLIRR